MTGYVDDCNGQVNQFQDDIQPSGPELLKKSTAHAQLWHDTLGASGGALEYTKCSIQVMSWLFSSGGAPVLQSGDKVDDNVMINNTTNERHSIRGLSGYDAHKTLGHYKDPAGNQMTQERILRDKCKKATEFIQQCLLERKEAWTFYQSIFLTGVGYPLASCNVTKDKLDSIQAKAMNGIFSRCGYNKKTKQTILFGPTKWGGAGFWSLYTIQSIGQLSHFLKYWRGDTQAGKLLRTSVAWTQYALGTSVSFLSDVNTILPHMEPLWLSSVRQYLKLIHGSLEVDNLLIPGIQRQYDSHIMDNVIQSAQFTHNEVRHINYFPLYLDVVTVLDMTNPEGNKIYTSMLYGKHDDQSSHSRWHRINQKRPGNNQWSVWRRANALWSNSTGTLYQTLGQWIVTHRSSRRHWPAYLDSQSNTIFVGFPNQKESIQSNLIQSRRLWHVVDFTVHVTASRVLPSAIKLDMLDTLVDSINTTDLESQEWVKWISSENVESNAVHTAIHSDSRNMTLQADWDLLNEIRWTFRQFPQGGTIQPFWPPRQSDKIQPIITLGTIELRRGQTCYAIPTTIWRRSRNGITLSTCRRSASYRRSHDHIQFSQPTQECRNWTAITSISTGPQQMAECHNEGNRLDRA